MHRRFSTRGFTLIELMVVIGIVGTLIVLLLPTINSALEASRRTTCVARQTRLALGMATYDSRQNCLPGVRNNLNITGGPVGAPPSVSTPNWFIMLLPVLERQDLFDAVAQGKIYCYLGPHNNAGNNNWTTGYGNIKGLGLDVTTCPSKGDWSSLGRVWSNMHYRANGAGISSSPFNRNDGAIGDNANGLPAGLTDIASADGTSTTLLIAEGGNQTWWPDLVQASLTAFPGYTGSGGGWFWAPKPDVGGNLLFGFTNSLRFPPLGSTGVINSRDDLLAQMTPSSAHPGGAVVAFADGSNRFLKDDLKPHVYGHLVTSRSTWTPITATTGTYATNSGLANSFLQCTPAPKPYTLQAQDY